LRSRDTTMGCFQSLPESLTSGVEVSDIQAASKAVSTMSAMAAPEPAKPNKQKPASASKHAVGAGKAAGGKSKAGSGEKHLKKLRKEVEGELRDHMNGSEVEEGEECSISGSEGEAVEVEEEVVVEDPPEEPAEEQ
jgi:hypothetical protein